MIIQIPEHEALTAAGARSTGQETKAWFPLVGSGLDIAKNGSNHAKARTIFNPLGAFYYDHS